MYYYLQLNHIVELSYIIIKDDKPRFKDGKLMVKKSNGLDSKYLSYGLTNFIRNKKRRKTSNSAYSVLNN
jgi:hypothetical protein